MYYYANLEETRRYLALSAGQDTGDDDDIKELIIKASRAIMNYTRRSFHPQRKTLYFDIPEDRENIFIRNFDLLEVKGLSDKAGTRGIDLSVVNLLTGTEQNLYPKDRVHIRGDSGSSLNYTGLALSQVHIDSIIGYHEDYTNAWVDTSASAAASATSAASIIGLGLSSGRDVWYSTPRYAIGDLLKIGDEFIAITGFSSGSDVIVKRGMYGSTQASFASGASVAKWEYEQDINFSAQRLAAFMYQQQSNPFGNQLIAPQFGVIEIPEEWPPDVKMKLQRFIKGRTMERLF